MTLSKQVIGKNMKMTYFMDGCVNGHDFTIEGEGTGKPYEGHQTLKLRVTKGGPLPFAFDLLSPTCCCGNRCFVKYPGEIADYFKQAFPEGLSWERSMTFEDGGFAAVSVHISLKGNCFVHKSKVVGVNFPTSSPVIQNKTLGWEPSTEKMTVRDGVLMGDVPMFLKLEEGGTMKCHLTTTYKTKKGVEMPKSHFVWYRLIRNTKDDTFELQEDAEARY